MNDATRILPLSRSRALPWSRWPAVFGAIWLSACAGLPPKPVPAVLPHSVPLMTEGVASPWPQREWWRGFNDEALNVLVTEGLAASVDLAGAQARVDAARAAVAAAVAAYGPQISGAAQATRERISDHGLFPPELLGFNWYNQFDLGAQGSYLIGRPPRTRALTRAAIDTRQAAEAERDAMALALPNEIARTYWGWQSDQARLTLVQQMIVAAERALQISAARVTANIARTDDSQSAQLDLLKSRQHRSDLEISAQLRLIALAALLGRTPEQLPVLTARPLPQLHTGLPENATIDLIARRADIAAARWRVEANARQRDFARNSFYPDVSLKALLGVTSRDLGVLLQAGSAAPSVAVAVHLPLFDSGTLKANYARSQANLDDAVAHYRAAILGAAREVNSQLAARANAEQQTALREQEVTTADALRAAAEARATSGITDDRPLLSATQQWLLRRELAVQSQSTHLNAELELIQALGGGYLSDPQP